MTLHAVVDTSLARQGFFVATVEDDQAGIVARAFAEGWTEVDAQAAAQQLLALVEQWQANRP